MPAMIHDANVAPESHGPEYHSLGSVSELLQEAFFFPLSMPQCQKICLNHYLKFLSRPSLFPELLTRNKMCWLEFYFLSSPAFPLWGPQWVMKWLWSGNIERSEERSPVSVNHADVREQRLCSTVLPRDTTPEIIGTYFNKLFIS